MSVEDEEDQPIPILEQDEEAAADTAAPSDEPQRRRAPITLDQMWTWLYEETMDRRQTRSAFQKHGGDTRLLDNAIDHLTALANSIAFLIDNEQDIREFVRAKREKKKPATPQRRFGGRSR